MSRPCVHWHVALLLILLDANCLAQVPISLKPRVVYERDLKNAGGMEARTAGTLTRGTLTRLGSDLLLNDPVNSQIIVVDTKTLAESKIPLELPAIDVKIDPETDMLFVETLNQSKTAGAISSQTCYENLEKLRSQTPQWTSDTRLQLWQEIRSLQDQQRFVLVERGLEARVILLDKNGVNVGEQKIKGNVLGVDEVEDGFNVFSLGTANKLVARCIDGTAMLLF